jgi:hypothetical protein
MSNKSAKCIDVLIARVAASQHGVISLTQLQSFGLSRSGITNRVRTGRLHRVHQGVYAVGHGRLSNEGWWTAAVLAYGGATVLSHRSAAQLCGLLHSRRGPVDVTVPGRSGRRRRDGIRLHRSTTLTQQQSTRRLNIPVTTPARTLEDLRGCATPDELSRARRKAEFLGYRAELAEARPIDLARSELERRFLRLCGRHHLPAPLVNAALLGYEVDFLWPLAKLVVETDGRGAHSGPESIERDRRREARLAAAGYEVLRFTWRQVVDHPREVVGALRPRLMPVLPSRSSAAES